MRTLIVLLLAIALNASAAYTEFYINNAGGGNTNSGHTADATPTFSAQNGFWTNYTGYGVFFKAGMSLTGVVTNNAWAAVYTNDSTATAFVGIITNVDDAGDFIFVKTVEAKGGTAPTQDDLNGKTHITVGGAWLGPGTYSWTVNSNTFPTALVSTSMTNMGGTRINWKGGTTYSVTNALTIAAVGPLIWSGYTSSPGDGGMATISGSSAPAGMILLTYSGTDGTVENFIFDGNGPDGTTVGVSVSGVENLFKRCASKNMRNSGFLGTTSTIFDECEASTNNVANTSAHGGFKSGGASVFNRCISHDNAGANSCGFFLSSGDVIKNSISYRNGGLGIRFESSSIILMLNCDIFSNGSSGIDHTSTSANNVWYIENCNFIKNGAYGINSSGGTVRNGIIINCGFGSGTMVNASGNLGPNMSVVQNSINVLNSVNYANDVYPWVDPTNGNFRISLAASKATGLGAFLQTEVNSPTNTVSYPDLGSTQNASTNAASGTTAYTFSQ